MNQILYVNTKHITAGENFIFCKDIYSYIYIQLNTKQSAKSTQDTPGERVRGPDRRADPEDRGDGENSQG